MHHFFLRAVGCLVASLVVWGFAQEGPLHSAGRAKRGGGLYFTWGFTPPPDEGGYRSMELSLEMLNAPGTHQGLFFSTQLFCGSPSLRNTFYFGIQTDVIGRGKGVVFSRWGSRDLADTETPEDVPRRLAWAISSPTEAGFIGVRRLVDWGKGRYRIRVSRVREDDVGRWFGVWIEAEGGEELYCGALRFPRDDQGRYPLVLAEGAGSFVEHYTEVASAKAVAEWHFLVHEVTVNDGSRVAGPVGYRYAPESEVWSNSDLSHGPDGWPIRVDMGGATRRENPAGGFQVVGAAGLIREIAGIIEEHFFDPDLRGLDWKAIRRDYARQAERATTSVQRSTLINRMLATLETSHTHHFTPDTTEYYQLLDVFSHVFPDWLVEQWPPDGVIEYPGIGLVTREREGRHFVIGKIDGTPAGRSLIAVGDAIVAVDDEPFRPIRSFEGKVGQTVRVTIQRTPSPDSRRTIEVVPEMLQPSETFRKAIRTSARVERRGEFDIAYVRIWSYAGEPYQRVLEEQLRTERLAAADALVLDLRGGWGGASPRYLNLFNTRVPVMQSRGREGEWRTFETQWRKPVVLLVNEGTRSGKEVLAHGFRTKGIGPVVGTRTAGAVTAGRLFRLSNHDLLYVAVAEILVDGENLEGRGVEPDVEVPFDVSFAAGRDPQLEKALEVAVEEVLRASSELP